MHVLREVADLAAERLNVSCEVIDMVSILPWDRETVFKVRRARLRGRGAVDLGFDVLLV